MRPGTTEEAITAWAALATGACFLPAVAVGVAYPTPPPDGPASQLAAYLADHRTTLLVVIQLTALAWGGLLLVFGAGLQAILRRAEGGSGVWSSMTFGACIATAVTILTALLPVEMAVYRGATPDAHALPLLFDALDVGNLLAAFPNAVYTVAAAIVILRTDVMPRWIGYGALVVAAIHLLSAMSLASAGAFTPSGLLPNVAPLSHMIWLVCVRIVLLRG